MHLVEKEQQSVISHYKIQRVLTRFVILDFSDQREARDLLYERSDNTRGVDFTGTLSVWSSFNDDIMFDSLLFMSSLSVMMRRLYLLPLSV